MKKIILSALVLIGFTANAQNDIVIQVGGTGADISGTTIDIVIDPNVVNDQGQYFWTEHFVVTNNTGTDATWTVARRKINVPATWNDQLCWPPQCYPMSGDYDVTPDNPSGANPAPTVINGTSTAMQYANSYTAELKPQVTPDFTTSGGATYRYYVNDAASGTNLDSFTVNLVYPLSVESLKKEVSVNIGPNPASDYVTVNMNGVDNAKIRLIDVLGNVVYNKAVSNSSNKLNVTTLNNGVYFIVIDGEGIKPVTKKLVVRH